MSRRSRGPHTLMEPIAVPPIPNTGAAMLAEPFCRSPRPGVWLLVCFVMFRLRERFWVWVLFGLGGFSG